MNRKGQIDFEVLTSPGFIILAVMAIAATIIGWKFSGSMTESGVGWPLWQIGLIIVAEVVAAYVFAARG